MRAFLIVFLIFSCQAEKNLRIWKGTDFYASWTAGGSNRPSGSQQRSHESIFDGDSKTIWHGKINDEGIAEHRNFISVEFIEPVEFNDVIIQLRSDEIFERKRYRNITVIVDDDEKKQIDLDVKKGRFSLSRGKQFSLWDDGPLVAKNITIKFAETQPAVIAELEIHYTVTDTSDLSKCCSYLQTFNRQDDGKKYFQNGTFSNRPVFATLEGENGFWFDKKENGLSDWSFGKLSNLETGRSSYSYFVSDEDTLCPEHVKSWKEFFYNEWKINEDIGVKCSKYQDDKDDAGNGLRKAASSLFLSIIIILEYVS